MFLVLLEGGQVKTTVIIVVCLKMMGSTFMKYEKQFWYTYVFQIVKLNIFFKMPNNYMVSDVEQFIIYKNNSGIIFLEPNWQ